MDRENGFMVKKLLLTAAIVLGLIYGLGSDLGSVKRSIKDATNGQARGVTGNTNDGWGANSGY